MKRVLTDLQEAVEPFVAEQGTEAAHQAIHETDSAHTSMLWEDGEITHRKNGDLWGHRSLHQQLEPWLPRNEIIWEVPDDKDHEYKVVTDKANLMKTLSYYIDSRDIEVIGRL